MKYDITAIIPARMGSKRFPNKNQILWKYTDSFIQSSGLFKKVIISSDGSPSTFPTKGKNYFFHKRAAALSKGDVAIKPVVEDVMGPDEDGDKVFCLLYLTHGLELDASLFKKAIQRFHKEGLLSMLSFFPSKESPYLAHYEDMSRVIDHDFYRFQDYKPTFQLTHYICLFRASVAPHLDNELFNKNITKPFFLEKEPLDIDYKEDLDEWLAQKDASNNSALPISRSSK